MAWRAEPTAKERAIDLTAATIDLARINIRGKAHGLCKTLPAWNWLTGAHQNEETDWQR